jgi:hypothetical protein
MRGRIVVVRVSHGDAIVRQVAWLRGAGAPRLERRMVEATRGRCFSGIGWHRLGRWSGGRGASDDHLAGVPDDGSFRLGSRGEVHPKGVDGRMDSGSAGPAGGARRAARSDGPVPAPSRACGERCREVSCRRPRHRERHRRRAPGMGGGRVGCAPAAKPRAAPERPFDGRRPAGPRGPSSRPMPGRRRGIPDGSGLTSSGGVPQDSARRCVTHAADRPARRLRERPTRRSRRWSGQSTAGARRSFSISMTRFWRSEGLTPGMRDAWARVAGARAASFCRASNDRERIES